MRKLLLFRGSLALILTCFVLPMVSCQTVRPSLNSNENLEDVQQAIGTVAGALSGQPMSKEDVNKLMRDIRTNPDSRSAVESMATTMDPQNRGRVKYSPATGKRYAPHLEYDPETGVRLEYLE